MRQTPFSAAASAEELVSGADAEHRSETGHVALNWQGQGVITAFLQALGFPVRPWNATTMGVALARELLEALENAGPDFANLAGLVGTAVDAGWPLILAEEGPRVPDAKELLAEECFHRAQYIAGGGDTLVELSAASSRRLARHPAAVVVRRFLQQEANYPFDELQYEVPAHIMRGPGYWARAGISPQQAVDLIDLYYSLVQSDHGTKTANTLREAANAERPKGDPLRREGPRDSRGRPRSGETDRQED